MKKTYTIDRRTWDRGRTGSLLLGPDEKQCCLGFICEQAGVAREKMFAVGTPAGLVKHVQEMPSSLSVLITTKILGIQNSPLAEEAMRTNDRLDINDASREQQLISLFKSYDITLEFVD